MNSNFFDLTVTFYAFDFNSYACSPDEVNEGLTIREQGDGNAI